MSTKNNLRNAINLVSLSVLIIFTACSTSNTKSESVKESKQITEINKHFEMPYNADRIVLKLKDKKYIGYEIQDIDGKVLLDAGQVARQVILTDEGKTTCYDCPKEVDPKKDGFGKCTKIDCCTKGNACGPLSSPITITEPSDDPIFINSITFGFKPEAKQ